MLPTEASAIEAQRAIAEEFSFFGDWSERLPVPD
jgi:cysteine desulfuration protein SufE